MVNDTAFPPRGALTIAFAHVAYRAAEEFAARRTGVAHFEVRTLEDRSGGRARLTYWWCRVFGETR